MPVIIEPDHKLVRDIPKPQSGVFRASNQLDANRKPLVFFIDDTEKVEDQPKLQQMAFG